MKRNNKKPQKKVNTILILIILFVLLSIAIFLFVYKDTLEIKTINKRTIVGESLISNWKERRSKNSIIEKYNKKILTSEDEYEEFIQEANIKSNLNEMNFSKYNYVLLFEEHNCRTKFNRIKSIKVTSNIVTIDLEYENTCDRCVLSIFPRMIPVKKSETDKDTNVVIHESILKDDIECEISTETAAKPIIYLYPKEKTDVTVKLLNQKDLTTTYPKYNNSWNVTAYPNGNLIDNKTGRSLYGLYWEGNNYNSKQQEEGFVVKGEDTISFLEDSLAKLGLTEREANEFIIYWLPKLEVNNYNYIHFSGNDFMNKEMPLEVNPKPDTTIRVLMEYKALKKPIKIKEQKITTPERNGFTLVEWGGTKLK